MVSLKKKIAATLPTSNVTTWPISAVSFENMEQEKELRGENVITENEEFAARDLIEYRVENHHESSSENSASKARWKREEAKRKRCHGESYLGFRRLDKNKTNKISQDVPKSAVSIGPPCTSKLCKRAINARFCSTIAEPDRVWLFHQFWSLPDWEEKKKYIASLIEIKKPKQRTKKGGDLKSRRENSFVYHLKIREKNVAVCKQLFENTFGLKWSTIRNWIKKYKAIGHPDQDSSFSPAELVAISLDLSDEEDSSKKNHDTSNWNEDSATNVMNVLTKFGRIQGNEDFKFCQFMFHEMKNLSSGVKRDLQRFMQRALFQAIERDQNFSS